MVKVKDMNKEDYFMYSTCMINAEKSYTSTFWIMSILLAVYTISAIYITPNIIDYIMIGILTLVLIINYIILVSKYIHIKRLFNVVKGFSLLN